MKRQRGRGRKSSNPANRSYESNGPDVKIRGNASQIYDKYLQYARDAQTSGDRIAAEAYFQHAEHYYRIMAANAPKERFQQNREETNTNENSGEISEESDTNSAAESSDTEMAETGAENAGSSSVGGLEVVEVGSSDGEELSGPSEPAPPSSPPRRRGRPRRRPQAAQSNTEEAASAETPTVDADQAEDAGLRAMMARSAPINPDEIESADS